MMNKQHKCLECSTSSLCPVTSRHKIDHQNGSCPKGYWISLPRIYWLLGDLACGGITNFLKTIIPHLPNEHYFSLASNFQRDSSAFPSVIPFQVFPHPSSTTPFQVHIVSRHPQHTPFTSAELELLLLTSSVFVHAHGPGSWTQQCIDYVRTHVASATLICNSAYTANNLTIPLGWTSTVIPLPIAINRSPFTRTADREFVRSLFPSSPPYQGHTLAPDPKKNWAIYCGRSSPEKNLPLLSDICKRIDSELIIVSNEHPDYSKVSCKRLPWQSDLSRLYNAADLCICTSLSEGGPIFAIEAMLHGVTTFSTPVGHMPSVLPPSRLLYDTIELPDELYRPHSIKRRSEDVLLAFSAAQFFAASVPKWKEITR